MSKASYLAKNVGVLAIGNFSSKILVFLLVPLYTAVLTTGDYGAYDIIFSSCGLLTPILTLNIAEAMLRFPLEEGADVPRIARIGLGLTLLSGIIVLAGQVIPGAPWGELAGWQYIAPLYTANALYQLLVLLARGTEHIVDVAVAGIMSALVMVSLNVAFLVVLEWGLDGFFVANIASMLLPALYLVFRLRSVIFAPAVGPGGGLLPKMVRYSLPLSMAVIGWWFVNASDRYIVLALCGVDANGLYSVAYKIPAILSTVATVFIQAWQITAVKEFDARDGDGFLIGIFDAVEMAIVLICAFMIPASPLIAQLMFSGEFYSAWMYVPFLLVYTVLNTMGGMWAPFFSVHYDTTPMAVSTLLGGVANVVLGIPLVMLTGVQGAAFSSLAAGLVNWAWRGVKVKKHIDVDFHMGRSLVVYVVLVAQGIVMIAGLPDVLCFSIQGILVVGLLVHFRKTLKSGFSLAKDVALAKRG